MIVYNIVVLLCEFCVRFSDEEVCWRRVIVEWGGVEWKGVGEERKGGGGGGIDLFLWVLVWVGYLGVLFDCFCWIRSV